MKTNFVIQLNDLSKEFKDSQRNFIQSKKKKKFLKFSIFYKN